MRHLHATSEELYVILDGAGEMEIEGDRRPSRPATSS